MANNNAKIKFLSGQYAGSEIELTPFTAIVLGRNPAVSNFVFSNENISRKPCSIQYNPNDRRFAVSDYSSSGTYINNVKRMQQGSVEYLNGGDTIKLGRTDEIIQLIAPQRFENERGASDQDIYDDDDDDMYEAVCPNCQNTIVLSDSVLDEGTMHCPCCNELLEFDYSDLTMDDLEHKEEDAEDAESETEPEA